MKTFSENRLSLIIVIVAVIIGYALQYVFNLPLIARRIYRRITRCFRWVHYATH